MKKVSISIPVFNGEETIKEVIEAINSQSIKFDEIILINDCSTDNTMKIVDSFPNIKKINNNENKGLSYCRNLGIKSSRNQIVAGIDADVVLDKYWLENIIENLKDDTVMCGGNLIEKYIDNKYNKWRSIYYKQNWGLNDLPNPPFLYGCNTIQKKSTWEALNGYDENFRSNGEDVDYSKRLTNIKNYKLFYSHKAKCYHLQNDDLNSLSNRVWRYHSYGYKIKKPSYYRFLKLTIKQFKFFFQRLMKDFLDLNFLLINLIVLINFIKLEFKRFLKGI